MRGPPKRSHGILKIRPSSLKACDFNLTYPADSKSPARRPYHFGPVSSSQKTSVRPCDWRISDRLCSRSPLIAVEDYPHIRLAANQTRNRSFMRAEPFPQLINGSRIAREFPCVDVINRDQQRSRERDRGDRSPRGAQKPRAPLSQIIPPGERDQRNRRRHADEVSRVTGGSEPSPPEHQRMRDEQNQKGRYDADQFAPLQQSPQPGDKRRDHHRTDDQRQQYNVAPHRPRAIRLAIGTPIRRPIVND